ncbi:MAG: hypothetical protein ACOYK1_06075 [Vampirovibrionia bacterium]|jgi:hypothetical protein
MVTLTSSTTNPSIPSNNSLLLPSSSGDSTLLDGFRKKFSEIIDSYGQLASIPPAPKEKENPWLDFVLKHSSLGQINSLFPLNKLFDNNLGNISEQSFLKYINQLKQDGITYSLTADGNPKQTNCIIAVGDFLKKYLTPDQIESINWNKFYNRDGTDISYEERIAGAPGALSEAGLTDQVLKSRDKENSTPEKRKAFIGKFREMIEAGALVKWDLAAQSTGEVPGNSKVLNFTPDKDGRVIGGHETMLSKKDLELVKDPKTGEVIDIYFRVTGAHWEGNLGVSEGRFSLVKDFLEPGNHLTLATLKPEILSKIADKDPELVASSRNNLASFIKLQPFIIP